ncbi:DNA repair protein RadC [Caldicellulosiruptor acetigenus I77R1B]|uniref:DNA repair protein RadC n=1 Tax=Caldicellulosiruptor acetigenus (strain ATCC 700853 / DSM 12137 / I77R1B) TaxID=632335 RepID=E4S5A1_CALA7|nr:JAB domain-containing protein [Caldicellulosiruptor acetigenus]ADQ41535.1 DNA repair protein RadC [Caldicellulosiruptor acetigenus I77R1B]
MKQLTFADCPRTNMVSKYKLVVVREESFPYNTSIRNVSKAVEFLKRHLRLHQEPEEVFIAVATDPQLNPVAVFEVARGTLTEAQISMRELFKRLIISNCNSFIVAHNHPGGSERPSLDDVRTTDRIRETAKLLGITFNDHIIVTEEGYYSFAENNMLQG